MWSLGCKLGRRPLGQNVKKGVIKLNYCTTEENVADLMTKPLGPNRMKKLRSLAGLENAKSDDHAQHLDRGGVLFTDQRNAIQM